MRPGRCGIALGTLLVVSGCYAYVPADVATIPVGQDVRVHMTRRAIAEIEEVPDQYEPYLTGTLLRRADDGLFIRVPVGTRQMGFHTAVLGQEVRIPNGEIVQVERRKLDPFGTTVLVAGSAAGAAIVIALIMEGSARPNIEEPPPEELRGRAVSIPVFSIRFR